MVNDNHLDAIHPERFADESQDFWSRNFLKKLRTPKWQTREKNLPLLANPAELSSEWRIRFVNSGPDEAQMDTHGFEVTPKATLRFIGVVTPKKERPAAWLIYFRHTPQKKDFNGNLLELGVGDYFVGRMQVIKQVLLSGKKVGVIIPICFGSSGEFAGNQNFVVQCLREIEMNIYGTELKLPLLAASNSDSIFELNKFLQGCPNLRQRLKGIYDFDGSLRVGTSGISLTVRGARTFRYEGAHAMDGKRRSKDETDAQFLFRVMSENPARVPLSLSRWREHAHFKIIRPKDDPSVRHKLGDPDNEAHDMNDFNWLHHRIPGCMLHHGLANTPGL